MKKLLVFLLAICTVFCAVSCGDEPSTPNYKTTLEEIDGWYKRYEGYTDSVPCESFRVDAASATVIAYDAFGDEGESYPCRCEDIYFSIDFAEPIGTLTFTVEGSAVCDGDGTMVYCYFDKLGEDMRSQMKTEYTLDEIVGTWNRDGLKNDLKLIVTEEVYYTEKNGEKGKEAPATLSMKDGKTIGMPQYKGSALDVDPMNGPFSFSLWITENGKVMYDDFMRRFYVKDDVADDELAYLIMKYDLIRDAWYNDKYTFDFDFDGTLSMIIEGEEQFSEVGTWKLADGIIRIYYKDGTREDVTYGDKLTLTKNDTVLDRNIEW